MSSLRINRDQCINCGVCKDACPFGAISDLNGHPAISEECRLCQACLAVCPVAAISMDQAALPTQQSGCAWRGIMVYAEVSAGAIHPVTIELIGEAARLAKRTGEPVSALLIGYELQQPSAELLRYGIDRVYCYDYPELHHFRVDTHANVFADCIKRTRPSIVLVGATATGRSLAPRLAARFRTGLTADCTELQIKENGDLVQIRPAFGGNIMAQIITPHSRPQFATVRYKVMNPATVVPDPHGVVEHCSVAPEQLNSGIEVLHRQQLAKSASITDAEVLVVAGRGVKDRAGLALLEELAELLGGQLASTRALVEAGWLPHARQIGLSGRTVKPNLCITCGVSGAVQFTAGMNKAEHIFAINQDATAPIFAVAHYGLVGDLYQIVPLLISRLKGGSPA